MVRIPTVTRDQIPEELRGTFDTETAGSGGWWTSGPGSVMISSPEMRHRANALVNYLRDESSLSKKIQELTMILTARHMDCQYIWHAHSARAREQGISDEFVDNLRDGKPLPQLPADEQTVVNYATELFQNHRVTQATFQGRVGPIWVPRFDGTLDADGLLFVAGVQCQLHSRLTFPTARNPSSRFSEMQRRVTAAMHRRRIANGGCAPGIG